MRLERCRENQVTTRDASQHAAQINHHVRGGPEGVAANALVPRDVPDAAERAGEHGNDAAPHVPGNLDATASNRALGGRRKWNGNGMRHSSRPSIEDTSGWRPAG